MAFGTTNKNNIDVKLEVEFDHEEMLVVLVQTANGEEKGKIAIPYNLCADIFDDILERINHKQEKPIIN